MTTITHDGSKLAFTGVRAGEKRLWIKSLPDGRELPLFIDGYDRDDPLWSPDGTHLAYLRTKQNPREDQIMMWSAVTRQEEPVTSPIPTGTGRDGYLGTDWPYDWSPDGKSLLVTRSMIPDSTPAVQDKPIVASPGSSVWQLPLSAAPHAESHERRMIADTNHELFQAHFSPDERLIAFEAVSKSSPGERVGRPSSLYVTRASGGPWIPIVDDENWADKPRWSPDGRTIYFLWFQGSFFNVWGIHFNPETGKTVGGPFRVTSLDSPSLMISEYVGNVEISVSEKNLVTTLNQVSGGIWVLDNVDR